MLFISYSVSEEVKLKLRKYSSLYNINNFSNMFARRASKEICD